MSRRLINTLLFLFLSTIVVNAQTQFNPHTQINWPYVTGNGAPSASCSSKNYGEPYTDILSSPNVHYTCGAYGWFVSSGSGGSGGPVAPANTVFNITGDSRNLVSSACASGASIQGPITASTVSGGILTASMTNVLAAGNIITLADFTGGYTALNGQQVTVLSTGLSSTQFEAAVTGVSNGTSGTGSSACTYLASTLLKYSSVIPSSSSVVNSAVPNQTVYNMNTNYTSLYHSSSPVVTGKASYLIIQSVADFISSGGIANVASVESNLQSLWQKAHTDGYLILQESIIPHSCSIYDLNCAADIATVNGWLRGQSPQTGINGQNWDLFDDIAQILPNYGDAGLFLQSVNAGHLTDAGNYFHFSSWVNQLVGRASALYTQAQAATTPTPANITITVSAGSQTPGCSSTSTATMTGLTTSMVVVPGYTSSPASLIGWGNTGGMVFQAWASASNTVTWQICNQTSTTISYNAITFIVGAK